MANTKRKVDGVSVDTVDETSSDPGSAFIRRVALIAAQSQLHFLLTP